MNYNYLCKMIIVHAGPFLYEFMRLNGDIIFKIFLSVRKMPFENHKNLKDTSFIIRSLNFQFVAQFNDLNFYRKQEFLNFFIKLALLTQKSFQGICNNSTRLTK